MKATNIIPLETKAAQPKPPQAVATRFRVIPFTNKRTGGTAWCVTGIKRDGSRVRKNYKEQAPAKLLQIELENEWLSGAAVPEVRHTRLKEDEIRVAEAAFARLGMNALVE